MRVNKCDLSCFLFFSKLWYIVNIALIIFLLPYFILFYFFSRDNFRYFLTILENAWNLCNMFCRFPTVPDLRKYEIRNGGSIFQRWRKRAICIPPFFNNVRWRKWREFITLFGHFSTTNFRAIAKINLKYKV